jgi:putative membrane protein
MLAKYLPALVFGSFATMACAEAIGEKASVNGLLGVAPKTQDFVSEVAMSDMAEIAAAKIALQKGDVSENAFASQMIADHTKTSDALKAMVTSGAVKAEVPHALDSRTQGKIDKLGADTDARFKHDYSAMQVSAHKSAVSLFGRYAEGGENAKLKDWAATLPTLKHHLEMAEALGK